MKWQLRDLGFREAIHDLMNQTRGVLAASRVVALGAERFRVAPPEHILGLALAASELPPDSLRPGGSPVPARRARLSRGVTPKLAADVGAQASCLHVSFADAHLQHRAAALTVPEDFVALAHLFGEHQAALAGKHPFPDEMITRMGELGASLLGQIKPSTAVRPAPQRSPESILRDQLVVDRYDNLEVLTVVAIGKRQAAELLPALRSFAAARTKNAPTEPV
ncbi:MAG: hypothetical protein HY791_34630 [Deltaproteobacteria bacterium]|nr:hypothetical protein [Deltaproteobacteria bacterium]